MGSVVGTPKVDHAVEACKGSASTLPVMWIEFLLGQDISAILSRLKSVVVGLKEDPISDKVYLAREGHHL